MKFALIGHRGVGKTSLLQRLQSYFPDLMTADLDREIEKEMNLSVQEIFEQQGEAEFRKIERRVFEALQQVDIIACGAGFEINFERDSQLDAREWLWVRRATDDLGRIFFDRPRLEEAGSHLEEFKVRAEARNSLFTKKANFIYDLPEGLLELSNQEETLFSALLKRSVLPISGVLTARGGDNFRSIQPELIEYRNDIMPFPSVAGEVLSLFSIRKLDSSALPATLPANVQWDWPIELGETAQVPTILSCHERRPGESILDVMQRLEKIGKESHLKLAVVVDDFEELMEGYLWQKMRPKQRSFLPRSVDGRWKWFRLFMKNKQRLNFVRWNDASVLDQPTIWEWLSCPDQVSDFAAVLGEPVHHSYSPVFHQKFFQNFQMPFFAIPVKPTEWALSLEKLQELGLKAAAVTAPFKLKAFETATKRDSTAEKLCSVNTLFFDGQDWSGWNTDLVGFQASLTELGPSTNVAVWGGGGTLAMIQSVLPDAKVFSSRDGQIKGQETLSANWTPNMVIWAAAPEASPPLFDWKPAVVLDLNYREDSRAREWALDLKARYVSGQKMFATQALAQQEIWRNLLK